MSPNYLQIQWNFHVCTSIAELKIHRQIGNESDSKRMRMILNNNETCLCKIIWFFYFFCFVAKRYKIDTNFNQNRYALDYVRTQNTYFLYYFGFVRDILFTTICVCCIFEDEWRFWIKTSSYFNNVEFCQNNKGKKEISKIIPSIDTISPKSVHKNKFK